MCKQTESGAGRLLTDGSSLYAVSVHVGIGYPVCHAQLSTNSHKEEEEEAEVYDRSDDEELTAKDNSADRRDSSCISVSGTGNLPPSARHVPPDLGGWGLEFGITVNSGEGQMSAIVVFLGRGKCGVANVSHSSVPLR